MSILIPVLATVGGDGILPLIMCHKRTNSNLLRQEPATNCKNADC